MGKRFRRKARIPRTLAYLRVSTIDQDTEKNKADILKYANDKDFGKVEFVEEKVSGKVSWKERKIKTIIDDLVNDDRLIVPELSRVGRSTLEVLEILKTAKDKGINVYSVKEGMELNGTIQSKIMSTMLALFSELERDFISQRTKEALKARKAAGVKLGRPKGPGKSKLDKHREEIIALLKNGSTKAYVAKKYKTSRPNLHNWLKKNKIKAAPEM
ncbi:MAG: recombinase family protein [Desulfobacterales bacterium]|nr:recombinase family protein [Desulfobacterales bacterium]